MPTLLDQQYELVDVDRLQVHPENARRGDLELIGTSIDDNGFFGALLVQRSTSFVLAGNHRLVAARERGAEVVPVLWVDVDDDRARRILLVENRANDVAGYDDAALAQLLELLGESEAGLVGTGFDRAAADAIIAAADVPVPLTDPDDAPGVPEDRDVISGVGDVWLLGRHRLVCGDATDIGRVRSALGDRAAGLVFTDPPYGVSYTGGTGEKLTIANDDLAAADLEQLLVQAMEVAAEVLAPGGAFYVCSPSGLLETTFRSALARAGLQLRQQLVWVKNSLVLGRADYHGQHESMLYGWQVGDEPLQPPHYDPDHGTLLYGWAAGAAHTWQGGRKQTTVWEHARPARSSEHPTMKPVALVQRAIENSSRAGGVVLDLFAGSGSTLIAAAACGRTAALVELDPRYADVICRRWQQHTGIVPVLEATGEPTDFTSDC